MNDTMYIQPVKVAVIDDNEEFGAGIKMLLAKEDVEVYTAADGPEGLELVKQLLPDIVLLDIVLPGMDGIELCKRIRHIPELMGVYIVMLSSIKTETGQMAEGLEAGADGYIARPIPNRELLARLRTFIRLKRAEKALHESEKRFRVAQEMSPDGFTILQPVPNEKGEISDFIWVYENEAIARINETDPQKVKGKRILDIFPDHRGTTVFNTYLHVANTGKSRILEEIYVGEIISRPTWLRLVVFPMGDDIAILSQDITVRKLAVESLRESEARFRTIFEIASLGIAQVDPANGRMILVNTYYESITGYRREELNKMTFLDLTHPDDREKDWEIFSKAAEGKVEYRNEKRYVKKDGTIVWVRIHLAFIRDENYNPIRTVAICENITEQKEAERKIILANQQLKYHIENTPLAVVEWDKNFRVKRWTKRAEEFFGWCEEDVINKYPTDWKFVHEDDVQQVNSIMGVILNSEVNKNISSNRNYAKDGSIVHSEWFNSALLDENGKLLSILSLVHNVTERKKAEEALRQSEERHRLLAENTLDVIWVMNNALEFTYVNPAIQQLMGYTVDEWLGSYLTEHCDEVHSIQMAQFIQKEIEKGPGNKGIVFETEMLHKNGSAVPLEIHAKVIFNKSGEPVSLQGVTRDLTERKKAQEALLRIEWMLRKKATVTKSDLVPSYGDLSELNTNRLILDSVGKDMLKDIADDFLRLLETSTAVYEKNGDYALGIFASGWCRFLDQASRELCNTDDNNEALDCGKWLCHDCCWKEASQPAIESGQPFDIKCQGGINLYALPIFAGDEVIGAINFGYGDPPQDQEKLSELAKKYKVPVGELLKKAKEYESRPLYIIEMAKERLQVSANLIGEIVSRKIKEKEILKLNEELEDRINERTAQLEASNKELESFSYSVSHDLRAPLRHINGYIDLLNEKFHPDLPEKAQYYLTTVKNAARQMGTLIDELLQFSKTGRQELRKSKIKMNVLVKDVLELMKQNTEKREIIWKVQELPQVSGDLALLKQVWVNLLENAVKYTGNTQKAEISIGFKDEKKNFVFFIRDNGVGFNMKYAHKLFGVFQRLHSQAEFEGTGIGLANVQRIIHKHNGRVWAKAEPGKGATFYFSLPKSKEELS